MADASRAGACTPPWACRRRERPWAMAGEEAAAPRAGLTRAELLCARMAAEGLSNRGIAKRLFVTVRAVEMNLTAAYKKLGIGSRTELAGALASPDRSGRVSPARDRSRA